MKITAALAILLALASLAFMGLTFSNLLSGHFETRTCLTDCVRNYYFAAAALSIVSILLSFNTLFRSGFTTWSFLTLLFCGFPIAIVAGIFIIGNLGTLPH